MNQVWEVAWRSFAIALSAGLALVVAILILTVVLRYLEKTKLYWKRLQGDERWALVNESFFTGLAILQIGEPEKLTLGQYSTMREWMQAYFDAKRVRDQVTIADVRIMHAQAVMPQPGLVEQLQRQLEGKK